MRLCSESSLTHGRCLCPRVPGECVGGSMGAFFCGGALRCSSSDEPKDVSPLACIRWWLLGECIRLVVRGDLGGFNS